MNRCLRWVRTVLCLAGVLLFAALANAAPARPEFVRLSMEQGLSQSTVQAFAQDGDGFLWVGTQDGLNRYDGSSFTVFRNLPKEAGSLIANDVRALCTDRDGNLWVATVAGLDRFDRTRGVFVHYRHDAANPRSLLSNRTLSLFVDRDGAVWVGTNRGVSRYDRATDDFTCYQNDPANPDSMLEGAVHAVGADESGTVWVGCAKGLNRFNRESGTFTRFINDPNNPDSVSANGIRSILPDRGGIWICTYTGGLNRYDAASGKFEHFSNDRNDARSLGANETRTVVRDRSGTLWVGTSGGGLNRFDPATRTFERILHDPGNPRSLGGDRVWTLFEDRAGSLWVGTETNGISRSDPTGGLFQVWHNDPQRPDSLSNDNVWSILEDRAGNYWIGTDGGLNRFDLATGKAVTYRHDPNNPASLSNNRVWMILEDRSGTLWIGTEGGLNRFDSKRGTFERFLRDPANPDSIAGDDIRCVYEDRDGMIWICAITGGLSMFDPKTRTFTNYRYDAKNPGSLSDNRTVYVTDDSVGTLWVGTDGGGLNRFDRTTKTFVRFMNNPADPASININNAFHWREDRAGNFWVATWGGGLNRFDRQAGRFTAFTTREGLPNNTIYGIVEDGDGFYWLSTNQGICRFDPRTGACRNFDLRDGLPGNEFNENAFFKNGKGEIFFGGVKGLVRFDPRAVSTNAYVPPVVVTGFEKFGRPVSGFDPRSVVRLASYENVIAFEFSALNFIQSEKNRYAYRLENFENEWVDAGTRRYASYTNLAPGEYVFHVRACNNDGIWNETGASVRLIVAPPLWRTWWAYTLYVVLSFASIGAVIRFQTNRVRVRASIEEAQLRAENAEFRARAGDEIRAKNSEIMDSLRYAERIQQAFLPNETMLRETFPEQFILWQPKDIVSGDFYWFHATPDADLIALADCTGHGVPGALMSMIGADILNQIVIERAVLDPARILEELDAGIRRALKQDTSDITALDGMDIGLCLIDRRRSVVIYAGSRRSLYLVDERGTFSEIKGDRRFIGGRRDRVRRTFTNHRIELAGPTMLYLTTDGFGDQNNAGGVKFGVARLRTMLGELALLDSDAQAAAIAAELARHRGDEPQRDDIVVWGLRVTPDQ